MPSLIFLPYLNLKITENKVFIPKYKKVKVFMYDPFILLPLNLKLVLLIEDRGLLAKTRSFSLKLDLI